MPTVNVTPALPNPYQPPAQQERTAVAAVRPANPARDARDEADRQPVLFRMLDEADRERVYVRAETRGHVGRQPDDASTHTHRALAAYAAVADQGERTGLRELLGFDAYA